MRAGAANGGRLLPLTLVVGALLLAGSAQADTADECIASAERSQLLRRKAELRSARVELLRCGRKECPLFVQKDCITWLADVDRELPSVVVRVETPTHEEARSAHVFVDGARDAIAVDGTALALDPGEHTLQAEDADHSKGSLTVLARAGETLRPVTIVIDKGASAAADRPGWSAWPFVLGGAGVLSAAAGMTLWAVGRADRDTLYRTCAGSCSSAAVGGVKSKIAVGDVLVGLGLVCAGVGVYLGIQTASGGATVQAAASF